jgi:flavin reductase (DIM6/NTAB) family NADH-FMN oxidoreductase RutF
VIRSTEPTAATRAVEEATFRTVVSSFPAGVAVVATYGGESVEPHGMTASSFLAVSLRPMLVLVSVARRSRLHALLERQERYAVSLLDHRQGRLARRFAGAAPDNGDAVPEIYWKEILGAPVLEDACAHVVADIRDRHRAGDHTLFIGEVRAMAPPARSATPLGYQQGRLGGIALDDDRWVGDLDPWGDPPCVVWG